MSTGNSRVPVAVCAALAAAALVAAPTEAAADTAGRRASQKPAAPADVHLKNGGTAGYECVRGDGRPWVGGSNDRTLNAKIAGAPGAALRAKFQVAPLGDASAPEKGRVPSKGYQQPAPDGYLHASYGIANGDLATSGDGGTNWMWRVRGKDDAGRKGPWSPWCEFTVDEVRPHSPLITSAEYPANGSSGYDPATHGYIPGTFTFAPNGSGDVVKFFYRFSDGTEGTETVQPGASASVVWTPAGPGRPWVDVTAHDRAGNASDSVRYQFGVESAPATRVGWAMDDESGTVAHAVTEGGTPRPDADATFPNGAVLGEPGNQALLTDRSVRLNGDGQSGQAGANGPVVDTAKPFMFSTWTKLASTEGDQVVLSQRAGDGSVFDLGWIGGRWTFRHRAADGTTIASVLRDVAQPAGGAWTDHWVSLMGGYDPVKGEIWLRTQAQGTVEVCEPGQPWNCDGVQVLTPAVNVASTSWTAAASAGPLVFGASNPAAGRTAYLDGWIDDAQMRPVSRPDEMVLNMIYRESVADWG